MHRDEDKFGYLEQAGRIAHFGHGKVLISYLDYMEEAGFQETTKHAACELRSVFAPTHQSILDVYKIVSIHVKPRSTLKIAAKERYFYERRIVRMM